MPNQKQKKQANLPAIQGARLPWYDKIGESFGITKAQWTTLCNAIFPQAKSVDAVVMAMSYCSSRGLDVFKRPVHIVPIWDSDKKQMVETVWPGIAELRTTAARTKEYAGKDAIELGPTVTEKWEYQPNNGDPVVTTVTFPEWGVMTVYRVVKGHRCAFVGQRLYWKEVYSRASSRDDTPNSRWRRAPFQQFEKCVEAAALRIAFPEEIGGDLTADEMEGKETFVSAIREKPQPRLAERIELGNGSGNVVDTSTGEVIEPVEVGEPELGPTQEEPQETVETETETEMDEVKELIAIKDKILTLGTKFGTVKRLPEYNQILEDNGCKDGKNINNLELAQAIVDQLEEALKEEPAKKS